MSRYTGPRLKLIRSLGVELPGLTRKSMERRPYPPGQHGASKRRKPSVFGLQLKEKQKLRFNYGLTENVLRRAVKKAARMRGEIGPNLLGILESRLDNVVFRAGFAPTIPAARQLIVHGHIRVDGKKVDRPSFHCKNGIEINPSEKAVKLPIVESTLENVPLKRPEWMQFDDGKKVATVSEKPNHDSVPFPIEINMVVEYYSRRT